MKGQVRQRKGGSPTKQPANNKQDATASKEDKTKPILPVMTKQRLWSRTVMVFGVMIVVYVSSRRGKELTLAKQSEFVSQRSMDVACSEDYKDEMKKFQGCVPRQCGRMVSDAIVSQNEVDVLLSVAKRGMSLAGSSGGATILDMHSGALSQGEKFVNVYKLKDAEKIFRPKDFAVYKAVRNKIQYTVAEHFRIPFEKLHLTHPTFFSRIDDKPARTLHDEYWHPHVDKETYESFHYTSLLYLSDYEKEFKGGRFIFVDPDNTNRTIEPRKGRVSMFTSGSENAHFVEKVSGGIRFALTVSFTCDVKHSVADPAVQTK